MRLLKLFIGISIFVSLVGCASVQQPIHLSADTFQKDKKVGLLYTAAPTAETVYTGSIGLLDYAIISSTNEGLDNHLATLSFPEYKDFINTVKSKVAAQGIELVVIEQPMSRESAKNLKSPSEGKSKNNFASYKEQYGLDMLMLIDFKTIGTTRSYYGFIPTSEPLAQSVINGQLIDLTSDKLLWYSNASSQKTIPAPWDEAGNGYPNLTTSVYQTLDEAIQIMQYELNGTSTINVVSTATVQ